MKKALMFLGLLVVVVGIALLIAFFAFVRHWTAVHTGTLHAGPDLYYNFWSGFGSDLGEATLITTVLVGVVSGIRHINCHHRTCWRIGVHPTAKGHRLCRKHVAMPEDDLDLHNVDPSHLVPVASTSTE